MSWLLFVGAILTGGMAIRRTVDCFRAETDGRRTASALWAATGAVLMVLNLAHLLMMSEFTR